MEAEALELEKHLEESAGKRHPPPTGGLALQLAALYRDSFAPGGTRSQFEANI